MMAGNLVVGMVGMMDTRLVNALDVYHWRCKL
jgi:hypothetical protein